MKFGELSKNFLTRIKMENSKQFWKSKMFWFNVIVALIFGAQAALEQQLLTEKVALWIVLIGNTFLRAFWTSKKLTI